MTRITLIALPWMAMATAATAQIRPAQVSFTYFGALKAQAYRVADECFLPVDALPQIGWKASVSEGVASIDAEGTSLILPLREFSGKKAVPLCRAVRDLGGVCEWDAKGERLQVLAVLKSLHLLEGKLKVEASMNIRPQVTTLDDPNRIVIDFPGAKLQSGGEYEIETHGRLGQYKDDVVRVVWEHDELPEVPSRLGPIRGLDLDLFPSRPKIKPKPPTPQGNASNPESSGMDEGSAGGLMPPDSKTPIQPPRQTTPTDPPPLPIRVTAQPPEVVADSADTLKLGIKLQTPLSASPRIARPDPETIELILPKTDLALAPDFKLDSASVLSVKTRRAMQDSVLTIHLARPMGAEVSSTSSGIELKLLKPRVGNGKLMGKTIVVDPGHGGRDSGALSPANDAKEKDLTLSIGKLVSQKLGEEGVLVYMTRKGDTYPTLPERAETANRNNADFFVSVHINSLFDKNMSGSTTYFRMYNPMGQLLAECVQHEIDKVSGLPSRGARSDRTLYSTGLSVLRNTHSTIPAILVEVAFITNDRDRAKLLDASFQQSIAGAIVKGLKVYLGDVKGKN